MVANLQVHRRAPKACPPTIDQPCVKDGGHKGYGRKSDSLGSCREQLSCWPTEHWWFWQVLVINNKLQCVDANEWVYLEVLQHLALPWCSPFDESAAKLCTVCSSLIFCIPISSYPLDLGLICLHETDWEVDLSCENQLKIFEAFKNRLKFFEIFKNRVRLWKYRLTF